MIAGFPIPFREGRVPLRAPLQYRQARYHRQQQYLQAVVSTRGRGPAARLRHREPNAVALLRRARLDRPKMRYQPRQKHDAPRQTHNVLGCADHLYRHRPPAPSPAHDS